MSELAVIKCPPRPRHVGGAADSISPAPPRQLDDGAFLVFSGGLRKPCKGWDGFRGRRPSLEAAQRLALANLPKVVVKNRRQFWAHVVLGDSIISRWDGEQWAAGSLKGPQA